MLSSYCGGQVQAQLTRCRCESATSNEEEQCESDQQRTPRWCERAIRLVFDGLMDYEFHEEQYDEEWDTVKYEVRTPTNKVQVTCYGDESVLDLLARVAPLASEADRKSLLACLRVQTEQGQRLCATVKLADLDPDQNLILGQALSEASVAKWAGEVRKGCDQSHSGCTSSTASLPDEPDNLETFVEVAPMAGPSVFFVDEPHFGPSVLLKNTQSEHLAFNNSEKLVCIMTF